MKIEVADFISQDEMLIKTELLKIQQQVDKKQKELDELLDIRAEKIVKASMNGISKINIADMLDVSRQRIYAIIDNRRLKEEE